MAHYRRRLACHGLVGFIQSIQVSTKYVRSVRVHIVASVDGFDAAKERIFDAAQQKQPQEDIVLLTSFLQRQQEELSSIRVHDRRACRFHCSRSSTDQRQQFRAWATVTISYSGSHEAFNTTTAGAMTRSNRH